MWNSKNNITFEMARLAGTKTPAAFPRPGLLNFEVDYDV